MSTNHRLLNATLKGGLGGEMNDIMGRVPSAVLW